MKNKTFWKTNVESVSLKMSCCQTLLEWGFRYEVPESPFLYTTIDKSEKILGNLQ